MTKLPSNPLISEVLKAVHGRKTVDGKVKLLQEHRGDHIKALLIWNYDKAIESAIPAGDVPYKKNDAPAGTAGHTRLAHEWRTLYNFVRGGNDTSNIQCTFFSMNRCKYGRPCKFSHAAPRD